MKYFNFFSLLFLLVSVASCQKEKSNEVDSSNTFTDARDGKIYKTVTIGDQIWMAENLAYLPEVNNPKDYTQSTRGRLSTYFVYGYYGNDVDEAKKTMNYKTYGVLYSHESAKVSCPPGWRLPTNEEWEELIHFIGGETTAGNILKEQGTKYWEAPNTSASNQFSFSALPAGRCNSDGDGEYFYSMSGLGESTAFHSILGHTYHLGFDHGRIERSDPWVNDAVSVRCIKK